MVRICIFGDSIAHGFYDERGGWVDRLKRYLYRLNDDLSVYNVGISGDISDDIVERFEQEAKVRKPDIIGFAMGINDAQFLKPEKKMRVKPEKFRNNLKTLLAASRKFTDKVFFVGPTRIDESKTLPIPWAPNKYYYEKNVNSYNSILQEFCKQNEVPYLDVYGVLSRKDLADGLHPNTEGHRKIFEQVRGFLSSEKFI
jgi:lysophospholipase L1-like esterase